MSAAIDLAVRALVLLSIASAAAFVLRRRTASLRALVWTVALGALLLLPLATLVTPAWRVAVLPAPASPPPAPSSTLQRDLAAMREPGAQPVDPSLAMAVAAARPLASAIAPPSAALATAPRDLAPRGLAVLFALVSLALIARIAVSHARMARLVAGAPAAGGDWAALAAETARDMGIARAVPVRLSPAIAVPAVVGVFRPALLVPAEAADWPIEMRRAVVLHELAHVARRDAAAQLVCQVACALYWCIPLAWYAARRAAALRERASDDHVLGAGVRASTYAESLIGLARLARGGDFQAAALSMARPSRMRERVVAILDPTVRRGAPARPAVAGLLLASAAALVALAAVMPVEAAAAPAPGRAERATLVEAPAMPGTTVHASSASSAAPESPATPAAVVIPASSGTSVDAADVTAAPEAAPQAASGLCGGRSLDSTSISRSDDDGEREWKVTVKGPGCRIELRAEGEFEFNGDFTDVSRVSRGGFFRLDVTEGATRRQLEIEPDGSRTWRVDGRDQPYDAAARRWFAAFLVELDRRTAFGVDVRLPALLRQGGANAVLNETGLMGSDYARGVYYTRLAKATTLSPDDVTRILAQAADLTKSSFYAHEVIKAFAARGPVSGAQRAAVTRLIDRMDSDFYRAESVSRLVGAGSLDTESVDFLVRLIDRMESDFYKHQIMATALRDGKLTADQQARLTAAAGSIDSDHYASEALRALAATGSMPPAVRASFLRAVTGIDSAHYRSETLRALLVHDELSESDLQEVIALSAPLSDHYESETLRVVLRHRAASDRVRDAVVAAADGMSRHYREELRRAAGR